MVRSGVPNGIPPKDSKAEAIIATIMGLPSADQMRRNYLSRLAPIAAACKPRGKAAIRKASIADERPTSGRVRNGRFDDENRHSCRLTFRGERPKRTQARPKLKGLFQR